jgi:hypothetical protein
MQKVGFGIVFFSQYVVLFILHLHCCWWIWLGFLLIVPLRVQAAVVAEKAAKSITDLNIAEDSESSKGEPEEEESASDKETKGEETEDDKLRKSTLEKLEKASEDSILGQASYLHIAVSNLTCYCSSTGHSYNYFFLASSSSITCFGF